MKESIEEKNERLKEKFPNLEFKFFTKTTEKIMFTCKIHNFQKMYKPTDLLKKEKKFCCPECKKIIQEEEKLHPKEKLSYTDRINALLPNLTLLETPYATTQIIKVKCSVCGKTEEHKVGNLLKGNGCRNCQRKFNFIEEAKKKYGDFIDYSETVYVNKRTKIKYRCKFCGLQEQEPLLHLKKGCKSCNKKDPDRKRVGHTPKTTEQFIKDARKVHGDKYDYSKVEYVNKYSILTIKCPIHEWFTQKARDHLKCGCPYCRESKGERDIRVFLEKHNINFSREKEYDDLRDKDLLSYDFYIPDYNLLIEYNGEQHYDKRMFGKTYEEFLRQKHHDWMKRGYTKKHGINFLVIPYWEFDNIEKILTETLKLN